MDIILPRLPTELWEQCIIPLLQTPGSSYDKFRQIELIVRIGHKRQIKQCSYLLERNDIKWTQEILYCVYHPVMINIRREDHFMFFGGSIDKFNYKEQDIDIFTELDKSLGVLFYSK